MDLSKGQDTSRSKPCALDSLFELLEGEQLPELHSFYCSDSGLKAFIGIDPQGNFPALGGTRLYTYPNEQAALIDCARLTRGMSLKAGLAGLPFSGGKAVIIQPEGTFNRTQLLEDFAQCVNNLQGRYITAVDVGTTSEDMDTLAKHSQFVTSTSIQGNPSPYTSRGVYAGILAACRHKFGLSSDAKQGLLGERHIVVLGLGQVGGELARALARAGARLTLADINSQRSQDLAVQLDAQTCSPEQAIGLECDIFCPCALGGIINQATIGQLNCDIIAGSANNQLAEPALAEQLLQQDILYAPDFAINAGGLIFAACQHLNYQPEQIEQRIHGIFSTLSQIFQDSDKRHCSTLEVSSQLAEQRLKQCQQNRNHCLDLDLDIDSLMEADDATSQLH